MKQGSGGKEEAFGKDKGFRGGEKMATEIDYGYNLGGVGVVSTVRGGWLVWGGWRE